ncbi:MAG TPA: DNA translocase FtsK, partial [Anaerolineaceae bacterium]
SAPASSRQPARASLTADDETMPGSPANAVLSGSTAATAPNWALPTIESILDPGDPVSTKSGLDKERAGIIEETLASFGAPGHVVEIQNGPTITLFAVEPDYIETRNGRTRVRVSKIVSLADDLALALAASRIRIQAPVPGRNYVGIEVPNVEISRVALRDVMESESFRKVKSPLKLALGKNVSGTPICTDLTSMPHLLIAGTTGSGKSVCVNSILCALLLNNSPADLRMVLVDPKRVELTGYNGIPHLLAPVVVDAERVVGALQWILREMDARYHRFAQASVRNISEYNKTMPDRLPYLVVVIDELADLMMLAPDETERSITRLAQLARATGIHLILATQRPSVDVLTGLIKANFPARIAFAVASGIDSRVILDQPGAERLLGRGDMLFQAPDSPAPVRLQGVYVSDSEIQRLVETWRLAARAMAANSPASSVDAPIDIPPAGIPLKQNALFGGMDAQEGDPLLNEAIDLVRREGRASISMLQRRMRIGYTRAARLIDTMEERGIVGPSVANSQVREILDYGDAAPPPEDPDGM